MLTEDKKRHGHQVVRRGRAGLVPVDPADLMEAHAGTAGVAEAEEVPQADTKLTRVDVDELLSEHSRIWAAFSPNIKEHIYNYESKKPHYLPDILPYNVHDADSFESDDLDDAKIIIKRLAELLGVPADRIDAFEAGVLREAADASTRRAVPGTAPELWAKRTTGRSETPPVFIKRVYREWIGELQRGDLRQLDRPLYLAYAKWRERNGDDPELAFVDRTAALDAELERQNVRTPADAFKALTPEEKSDPDALRRASRLYSASYRRARVRAP